MGWEAFLELANDSDASIQAAFESRLDAGKGEDIATLIYTSGTTGSPKGALHGHRVLTGHLPGVEMSHDFLGQPGDCLWTPADWAWIGGLFDVLMPGLALGIPVVAAPNVRRLGANSSPTPTASAPSRVRLVMGLRSVFRSTPRSLVTPALPVMLLIRCGFRESFALANVGSLFVTS